MRIIKYITKRKRLLKFFIIVIVLLICIVSVTSYFKGNILPVILTMSEATVKELAVNAINNAAHMVIDESLDYSQLVNIVKDGSGKIQLIQANTVRINRLARDLANLSQKNVEDISMQTIALPIGAFTGSVVLAGVGPEVAISLLPIGSVMCDFVSSFEEVGINQTKHSIYLNVNTTISLVLPVSSVPVSICTVILVCENIIVGEVPEFYFGGSTEGNSLNLIPYA